MIMQSEVNKVNLVFEQIKRELAPKHKGKIVDIDSGNYFIGYSELESYRKGIKQYPNREFIFKRIGFNHAHFYTEV